MSQKMRILSVRVEGTPFTGCDRWGGPVYESDPDKVMEWLCNGWRYRFNRVRSRRMKYADPDHALLEPIGDTTDTSQTCSRCGYAAKENRENQAVFHCGECGLTMNADANAATNILSKGLRETEPYNPSDWGTGHVPGGGASDVHTAMSRMNAVPDEAETTMRKETPEHGIPAL